MKYSKIMTEKRDITGVKTIVVEWWDILINGNIIDDAADNDILWIISLEKEGQWWNILIDASVTDVHAILYADKSLLSSFGGGIADGNTLDSNLRNQLYINGSVFSENTTWWALSAPYTCPFYEENVCTVEVAKKYDLWFLRRYILVSDVDADWSPTWVQSPLNGWSESEMWDGDDTNTDTQAWKTWYRTYPFIIEYNSHIQTTPPPFF